MPNSGSTPSRAPRGAQPGERRGAKPAAKGAKSGNFKPREDGRGGRAPQRSTDAPRDAAGRKPRYTAEERARRDSAGSPRETRGGRPDNARDWSPRDERPAGRGGFAGRGRDDRAPRSNDDRPARREWSNDRPARSNDDRPARREWTPERPARSNDAPRREWSNDRPARSNDDRPARREWSNERPARSNDDRPARREWSNERPARSNDAPRRDWNFDRPARSEDRTPRREWSTDRPARDGNRGGFGADRDARRSDRVERDNIRDREFSNARDNNSNKKTFQEDVVLERLKGVDEADAIIETTFEGMDLHPKLITALQGMGAATPFPIQAATIPAANAGRDVLGRGKTGSGKTVAFSVPIVTKLLAGGSVQRRPGQARAIILAPTRELADQIDRTIKGLARPVGFFTVCIYGGIPQRRQETSMSRGTDIIVATPGRLEDLMAQGIVDLSAIETLVIDEADHMCDLGFIEPVRRIMRAAGDCQKLLFSATLDREVDSLVREFLPDPYIYEVSEEEEDHSNITHRVLTVDPEDRSQVLLRLVQGEGKTLIFTRTKMTAERLSESLTTAGVPAARLHGDLNQNQRNRNLERFINGHCRVLVATDVAARGIHVDDVALVVQVDPPEEYKTYLHRSGRTGRAGKEGTVITLIPRSRRRRMEDLLNRADRDGIFTEVRPSNPLLEELAGPIAAPPAPEVLDFGDSRGGNGGGRSRGDRDGRSGGAPRGNKGNYGGNGKGRWADRSGDTKRPRAARRD